MGRCLGMTQGSAGQQPRGRSRSQGPAERESSVYDSLPRGPLRLSCSLRPSLNALGLAWSPTYENGTADVWLREAV